MRAVRIPSPTVLDPGDPTASAIAELPDAAGTANAAGRPWSPAAAVLVPRGAATVAEPRIPSAAELAFIA
mgnify:CR=1 FL=1